MIMITMISRLQCIQLLSAYLVVVDLLHDLHPSSNIVCGKGSQLLMVGLQHRKQLCHPTQEGANLRDLGATGIRQRKDCHQLHLSTSCTLLDLRIRTVTLLEIYCCH